jgi:glycosyltransferase involved in cell wall biosynthesis
VRIGIDFYAFNPEYVGGVSTFSLGLVEGLLANIAEEDELVILVSEDNEPVLVSWFHGRNVRILRISSPPLAGYINSTLTLLSWLVREYRLRYWYDRLIRRRLSEHIGNSVDALIVPTTVLNFYALGVPTILCIHDIQHEYHPENFTLRQRIARWAPYRLSAARATAIQVSSNYIRDCLLEKFTFLSQQSFMIAPEGVDRNRFSYLAGDRIPQSLPVSIHQRYVFFPAQIWKHKNHALLMYALAHFRKCTGFEMPCVLTGFDYGHWKKIEKIRDKLGLKAVFYLGRVDLPELLWIYKNCIAVLALGLHESSSLPVREGAAFGKPLICADIPPNLEIAEYLHVNLFQKNSPESLATQLVAVYNDIKNMKNLATENIDLIKTLDWEQIAPNYIARLSIIVKVNSI